MEENKVQDQVTEEMVTVDRETVEETDSEYTEAFDTEPDPDGEDETRETEAASEGPTLRRKDIRRMAFVNRELSWIRFNERVLEEAEKETVPLAERLSFASIYQTNLDEFFMVRVGKLIHRADSKSREIREAKDSKSGMKPKKQLKVIFKRINGLIPRRDAVYEKLMAELEQQGIRLVDYHKIDEAETKQLKRYFDEEIRPLIEPNVVASRLTMPFLQNKVIYAVAVLETKNRDTCFGIIPCGTGVFPRLIPVEGTPGTYMLSEEMILHYMQDIFKGYTVRAKSLIRLTRNGDIDADLLYEDDRDYREFMGEVIRRRQKLQPVRLELSRELDRNIISVLCEYLKLDENQVFFYREPLDLSFLFQIRDLLPQNTGLFYPKRVPQRSSQFDRTRPILPQIMEGDKLLSYPYNSMAPFLEMLHEAATDETVTSIQMTLYRMAKQSKVIEYLIEAAENGKDVTVVVELKARFDEEANIYWSRRLEAAGAKVIYGIQNYKVHSKLCLITRRMDGYNQYITQVGTGNYNEKSARIYTDLCMMTANPVIGRDAQKIFSCLKKKEFVEDTDALLVAPLILRDRILDLIDEQIRIAEEGGDAYIGMKMNSLGDTKIMERLVRASMAGVRIEMVVRGVCCLVPGVPGITENIRIVSVVGRFLEHARVFIFGTPDCQKIYLGSADLMKRNTRNRVEIASPVLDEELRNQIRTMFDIQMSDTMQAREMHSDGTYGPVLSDQAPVNSQEYFYEHAYRQAGELLPEETAEAE